VFWHEGSSKLVAETFLVDAYHGPSWSSPCRMQLDAIASSAATVHLTSHERSVRAEWNLDLLDPRAFTQMTGTEGQRRCNRMNP